MTLNEFFKNVEKEYSKNANPIAYGIGLLLTLLINYIWYLFLYYSDFAVEGDSISIVIAIIFSLVLAYSVYGVVNSYKHYNGILETLLHDISRYRKSFDERQLKTILSKHVISTFGSFAKFNDTVCLVVPSGVLMFNVKDCKIEIQRYEDDDTYTKFIKGVHITGKDILNNRVNAVYAEYLASYLENI